MLWYHCKLLYISSCICLLGNKDKNGWIQFWNYAKSLHLSLDEEQDVTIITNQATFRLGGQIKFGIIYLHTQLNTTVY